MELSMENSALEATAAEALAELPWLLMPIQFGASLAVMLTGLVIVIVQFSFPLVAIGALAVCQCEIYAGSGLASCSHRDGIDPGTARPRRTLCAPRLLTAVVSPWRMRAKVFLGSGRRVSWLLRYLQEDESSELPELTPSAVLLPSR